MKKLLPLALACLFFQANAQVISTIDPETGQVVLAECDPEIISARPVDACCDTLTLTDIYVHNAGLDFAERKMVKKFTKSCRPIYSWVMTSIPINSIFLILTIMNLPLPCNFPIKQGLANPAFFLMPTMDNLPIPACVQI